jgi:hypothetical protein
MNQLLLTLSTFFWSMYFGPMLAFTVILMGKKYLFPLKTESIVRTYQAWGAGFGLSLGAFIFTNIYLRWQQYGEFALYWSLPNDQLLSLSIILGFFAWISNLILEVWSLDPLRKMNGTTYDNTDYESVFLKFRRHLLAHCALCASFGLTYHYGLFLTI